ncbi:unnamed protein product [Calicophoron daubneyi]|uniref:AN1-type domain-containing protein n=1 Tax=Calicophoron daubneyi TaxID=300641 RepID=A0AAV2T7W8_CALDB
MIRRILDSVPLMISSESHHENGSIASENISPVDEVEEFVTNSDQTEDKKDDLDLSDSSSSSPSPNLLPTSEQSSKVLDFHLFDSGFSGNVVSSASSCYVVPKPKPSPVPKTDVIHDDSRQSSPRTTIHVRRQSPSPCAVDLSSLTSRQLPGGPMLQQQRPQRSHLPLQNSRKKELHKYQNCTTKTNKTNEPNSNKGTGEKAEHEEDNVDSVYSGGMSSQADPDVMVVDSILLPFVRDHREIEIRIPVERLNKLHRRILKALTAEYELSILPVREDQYGQSSIVVRKKASLIQKQQIEFEIKEREAKAKALREAMEEALRKKQIELEEARRSMPSIRNICSQTSSFPQAPSQTDQSSRKKQKRLRRELRKQAKAEQMARKPKVVQTAVQTVPEDHWLCPWCLQHIPPESQCGHEAICRAGVRQKQKEMELKARLSQRNADVKAHRLQKLGVPLPKATRKAQAGNQPTALGDLVSGRSRSRSRNRLSMKEKKSKSITRSRSPRASSKNDPHRLTSVVAHLERVHPNDLGAMARLMARVCSEAKCDQLADVGDPATRTGIKCPNCHLIYCDHHRPVGLHSACPRKEPSPPKGTSTNTVSTACGWDADEKRAALKAAMRERKAMLLERRQRY